jgi:hypothetical protein
VVPGVEMAAAATAADVVGTPVGVVVKESWVPSRLVRIVAVGLYLNGHWHSEGMGYVGLGGLNSRKIVF